MPTREDVIDAIIGEALGEGDDGMLAVAYVMANRARESGRTLEQVATERGQFHGYSRPGAAARQARVDPALRARVASIVDAAVAGSVPDPTGGATYFHVEGTPAPRLNVRTEETATVGNHRFLAPVGRALGAAGNAVADAAEAVFTPRARPLGPRINQSADVPAGDMHRWLDSSKRNAPHHVDQLHPSFTPNLDRMMSESPYAARMSIGSGWRSPERQRELWENSDRSGRMVGKPGEITDGKVVGGSRHMHGIAADLYYNGKRLDRAPQEVQDWFRTNAKDYGLNFPMSYEPWHIEPTWARDMELVTPVTGAANMPPHLGKQEIEAVQRSLAAQGVDPGPIDGIFGEKTSNALAAFQQFAGVPVTGSLDSATQAALTRGSIAAPTPAPSPYGEMPPMLPDAFSAPPPALTPGVATGTYPSAPGATIGAAPSWPVERGPDLGPPPSGPAPMGVAPPMAGVEAPYVPTPRPGPPPGPFGTMGEMTSPPPSFDYVPSARPPANFPPQARPDGPTADVRLPTARPDLTPDMLGAPPPRPDQAWDSLRAVSLPQGNLAPPIPQGAPASMPPLAADWGAPSSSAPSAPPAMPTGEMPPMGLNPGFSPEFAPNNRELAPESVPLAVLEHAATLAPATLAERMSAVSPPASMPAIGLQGSTPAEAIASRFVAEPTMGEMPALRAQADALAPASLSDRMGAESPPPVTPFEMPPSAIDTRWTGEPTMPTPPALRAAADAAAPADLTERMAWDSPQSITPALGRAVVDTQLGLEGLTAPAVAPPTSIDSAWNAPGQDPNQGMIGSLPAPPVTASPFDRPMGTMSAELPPVPAAVLQHAASLAPSTQAMPFGAGPVDAIGAVAGAPSALAYMPTGSGVAPPVAPPSISERIDRGFAAATGPDLVASAAPTPIIGAPGMDLDFTQPPTAAVGSPPAPATVSPPPTYQPPAPTAHAPMPAPAPAMPELPMPGDAIEVPDLSATNPMDSYGVPGPAQAFERPRRSRLGQAARFGAVGGMVAGPVGAAIGGLGGLMFGGNGLPAAAPGGAPAFGAQPQYSQMPSQQQQMQARQQFGFFGGTPQVPVGAMFNGGRMPGPGGTLSPGQLRGIEARLDSGLYDPRNPMTDAFKGVSGGAGRAVSTPAGGLW